MCFFPGLVDVFVGHLKDEAYLSEVTAFFQVHQCLVAVKVIHVDDSVQNEVDLGGYSIELD